MQSWYAHILARDQAFDFNRKEVRDQGFEALVPALKQQISGLKSKLQSYWDVDAEDALGDASLLQDSTIFMERFRGVIRREIHRVSHCLKSEYERHRGQKQLADAPSNKDRTHDTVTDAPSSAYAAAVGVDL